MNQAPEIRLDRSRDFSTIHGERNPIDPHYRVHFFQDHLPFGADEILIPDDGKTESWTEALEREDGTTKIVRHHPLYTPKMRQLLEKRLKKLSTTKRAVTKQAPKEPTEDDGEEPQLTFGADEVNLISWLRGDIQYEPNEIYAAVKKRYGIALMRIREVVAHLVDDEKLLPEAQVSPKLLALLDEPNSAAA